MAERMTGATDKMAAAPFVRGRGGSVRAAAAHSVHAVMPEPVGAGALPQGHLTQPVSHSASAVQSTAMPLSCIAERRYCSALSAPVRKYGACVTFTVSMESDPTRAMS